MLMNFGSRGPRNARRLEDRIYALVEKAVSVTDMDELEEVLGQLRLSLREHSQRLRKMAASRFPAPNRRKTD